MKTGRYETVVTDENTAKTMKSGELDVFATPALVAALEAAAVEAIKDEIGDNDTTVGTALSIKHTAPSIIGAKITAVAEVIGRDGRKIEFNVQAFDEAGKIGEGTHERYIVNKSKFSAKAAARSIDDVK